MTVSPVCPLLPKNELIFSNFELAKSLLKITADGARNLAEHPPEPAEPLPFAGAPGPERQPNVR